jgi:hypothetical protein
MPDDLYPVPDDLGLGATVRGFVEGQRLFNRYILRRVLGRGGMGVVWLAQDDQLERDVALKFLPELITLDKEAIADLKRETRRSLELTHPHIVRIHDFVQDPSWAGISMEYVDGETLSALKVDQPNGHFEVETLRPWVTQLCDALTYAHAKAKVVHRDLKPANLMIGAGNDLKVADFGIARSVSDSVSRVTMRQGTSGTLAYMSPQQAMGQKTTVSDDIYSVGATLFDLLAGKPPFYTGEVYQQLLNQVPVSIASRREELDLKGEPIPGEWEETIALCLAKEPEQRPQSITEVAERLGLRDAPTIRARIRPTAAAPKPKIVIPPVGAGHTAPPQSDPSGKGGLIAALVVLVLLLGGLGYYFGIYAPAEQAREAEIAQQEAIEKEKEAEAQAAADAASREKAEAAAAQAEHLANARGGLMINTNPPGATVAFGGEDVQTSPATFKSVKLGSYPIHITLDGYEPVDQTAEIKENQFTDLGTINLVRSTGTLQVASTPPDASYTLRNDALGINQSGKCPDTIKNLPVGTYEMTVTRGDWTQSGTAIVKRNDTAVYSQAFAYGSATVTSIPPGAMVSENGKELGTTPLTLTNLSAGTHIFLFAQADYKSGTLSVNIAPNVTSNVSAQMEKIIFGLAELKSEPPGAIVSEDGSELGKTPLTVKELRMGQHNYTFSLPGYNSASVSADIIADTTTPVSAALEESFAGTWSGSCDGYIDIATPPGPIPYNEVIVVSADEKSVIDIYGDKRPARRSGNTLSFERDQADATLQLKGNGQAIYKETADGRRIEGTVTRQ